MLLAETFRPVIAIKKIKRRKNVLLELNVGVVELYQANSRCWISLLDFIWRDIKFKSGHRGLTAFLKSLFCLVSAASARVYGYPDFWLLAKALGPSD